MSFLNTPNTSPNPSSSHHVLPISQKSGSYQELEQGLYEGYVRFGYQPGRIDHSRRRERETPHRESDGPRTFMSLQVSSAWILLSGARKRKPWKRRGRLTRLNLFKETSVEISRIWLAAVKSPRQGDPYHQSRPNASRFTFQIAPFSLLQAELYE
jgi:hypothetical protein